jgi:hypothetical protein
MGAIFWFNDDIIVTYVFMIDIYIKYVSTIKFNDKFLVYFFLKSQSLCQVGPKIFSSRDLFYYNEKKIPTYMDFYKYFNVLIIYY